MAATAQKSLSVDLRCDFSMHRRRLLSEVTSLPPLVSTPRTISTSNVSENDDQLTDGVAHVDPITRVVEITSLEQ